MINLITKEWRIDSIETILFDKDGTFIDLHHFWGEMTKLRCQKIIEKFKLNEKFLNEMCLCLGYDLKSQKMLSDGITALYSRSEIIKIFKTDLLHFGIKISENELTNIFDEVSENFYQNMFKYTKPIDSAINFIKKVHSKGIQLGIVTSDSIKSTELTLKNFKWEYLFNTYIGRESSNHTKESGELTKLALNNLNADPKTTIMIGDTPMDYISAKNAGINNIILVATGQICKEELLKTSPFVINSLDEIKF